MITDKLFYLLKGIILLLTILNTQHTLLRLSCCMCCCTFQLYYYQSTDTDSKSLDKPVGERRRVLRKEGRVSREQRSTQVMLGELDEMLG